MSQTKQGKENTTKKLLIVAFALCVLSLSACSSLAGTSTPSNSSATHTAAPSVTVNTQSSCQVLHEREALLNQEYQVTSVELNKAQAGRN